MKVGMIAEATCVSKPWTVIPMVVTCSSILRLIAIHPHRGVSGEVPDHSRLIKINVTLLRTL